MTAVIYNDHVVRTSIKDRRTLLLVLGGICENLAAGWFGHVLISPGFAETFGVEQALVLTRSVLLGIVFMLASFLLFRRI